MRQPEEGSGGQPASSRGLSGPWKPSGLTLRTLSSLLPSAGNCWTLQLLSCHFGHLSILVLSGGRLFLLSEVAVLPEACWELVWAFKGCSEEGAGLDPRCWCWGLCTLVCQDLLNVELVHRVFA